jgi:xanthine/CO dehydrogenase XdhC/CoxF family maturation factor
MERKQRFLSRIVDIGAELFAISAACVRAVQDKNPNSQLLADALKQPARWIGVMGNPRHPGPHMAALRQLGVADSEIARVQRPIGLNIGSRTPPEIAIATLAGLIADRNGKPGGFEF